MEGKGLKKKLAGFTLVEILIDFLIVAVVGAALLTAYFAAFKSIDLARARMTAVSIANEKMEIYHNMPYTELGTQGGTPSGDILASETVTRNNLNLTVETIVTFVDDPFDGTSAAGSDSIPQDYKKVEVMIKKTGRPGVLARLVTNIASKTSGNPPGTGNVYICVHDQNGDPIEGATVRLENVDAEWGPEDAQTGPDGCAIFLAPDDCNHPSYHVSASYPDYSTDLTFPRIAGNPAIPLQPDFAVCDSEVASQTLSIDTLATLTINFTDSGGNPYPGDIDFWLEGVKKIANNPTTNQPVYKCSDEASSPPNPWSTDPYIANSVCSDRLTATHIGGASPSTSITLTDRVEFDYYKIFTASPPNYLTYSSPSRYLTSVDKMQEFYVEPGGNRVVNVKISNDRNDPRIWGVNPVNANISGTTSVEMDIVGYNFKNKNPSVKLIKKDNPAIEKTGTITLEPSNIPDDNKYSRDLFKARFDGITETGDWDLQVSIDGGRSVLQANALTTTN